MADVTKGARHFVRTAVAVGLIAPLLVAVGALGTKFGLWDWATGFRKLTVDWAPKAAMVGVGLGVLALLFSLVDKRRLLPWAVVALLIPAGTLFAFHQFRSQARAVPPIHDVATDWSEPLAFSPAVMAARGPDANPVLPDPVVPERVGPPWAGRRVAEINAETCPGARPIPRMVEAETVFQTLDAMGLDVEVSKPTGWRVEATARSTWFGFADDVVVRMRPGRTDVRSVSRVGLSDIGANCARVTEIVRRLEAASGG